MPVLKLERLSIRHVGPLDLAVNAGECVCLRGVSGSGKSLLLRAVADLEAHGGDVRLDQLRCSTIPAPQWRARVMLVGAESQWWAETVGAHFVDGCRADWLEALALPAGALEWTVARGSTGEGQRLALLRALMRAPAALLLDEPTGNLDEESTQRVEALLATYRRDNDAPVLWVSHDRKQGQRVARRRLVLADGQLVPDGDRQESAEATTNGWGAR